MNLRKMFQALTLCSALYLHPQTVSAENVTGNSFYDFCNSGTSEGAGFCAGYTLGLLEGYRNGIATFLVRTGETDVQKLNDMSEQFLGYCIPDEVTGAQIRDVFLKHLTQNPESRHGSARVHFLTAMIKAWPCSPN